MKECIFCKIANKETPCFGVYEDSLVKVFLDTNPVSEGHLLVIPKEHYRDIFETPDRILGRINQVCKKMALLFKEKLNVDGVNIVNASGAQAQQSVFHLHYHVIPRYNNDNLNLWFHGKLKKIGSEKIKELQKALLS